jgi:membrane associated rhomboid family serine protease
MRAWAVAALVAANAGVFALEIAVGGPEQAELLQSWGLVPRELVRGVGPHVWATPLTSLFLHASALHLVANVGFLVLFGRGLEARLGSVRFAGLYLVCGLAAAAAQVASDPAAFVPAVGASGAVSGVLGGQARFGPMQRVLGVPAIAGIVAWVVIQLLSGAVAPSDAATGAASGAHFGGFVAGFALAPLFRRADAPASS